MSSFVPSHGTFHAFFILLFVEFVYYSIFSILGRCREAVYLDGFGVKGVVNCFKC